MRVADFDYDLPADAIAQSAIEPRDASRLLLARSREDRRFWELPEVLDCVDLLVVNRTRVRAARLHGTKLGSGGKVELLLLRRLDVERWEALVRPARRIRRGTQIDLGVMRGIVLSDPQRGVVTMALTADEGGDVDDLLPDLGDVPLPPYFHGTLDDPERYQTVFATSLGSAAAPTAALHFTPSLLDRLGEAGVGVAEVELDVGLDTFRPMDGELITDHQIHRERYRVPDRAVAAVAATREAGGRIVAVGTTVVRTLETAAAGDRVAAGEGESNLFITPGYQFAVVDAMLTNFHAPRTTLIALVAAAMGDEWRAVYAVALDRGYRFLSFGDAMLIDAMRSR